jgi:UDP-N-acetylglucosamine acyltransferase
MACVHVAHDCRLGSHLIVANNVLIAGHVQIDDRAVINGAAAFHHFVSVGTLAYVGGMSRVVHDVPPFVKVEGSPARVRAMNTVGLKRNGFDDSVIAELDRVFRHLYRGDAPLSSALSTIEEAQQSEPVGILVAHLRRTLTSRKGRYLEENRCDV